MYKNQEGYADPTAGQALANIRREEKARLGYMPLVYICSPFRGDVEGNMRNARKYCAFALSRHALPIATHLLFPQFMGTKETPQTRELALHMALILLTRCNELWYFGDTVSEGMKKEISRARWRNIPVRHFKVFGLSLRDSELEHVEPVALCVEKAHDIDPPLFLRDGIERQIVIHL